MPLTNKPLAIIVGRLQGGMRTEPSIHGVEAASQTYLAGSLLQDDDAGSIVESKSPVDGSANTQRAFGLAVADATGKTAADVHMVSLIGDGVLLEVTLSDATAGTHTLAQGDQWQTYPFTKDTATGHWYLDANAASDTGGGVVVEFRDPIGTVDARVYAKLTRPAIGTANAGSAAI
jgi:hypothetical protein